MAKQRRHKALGGWINQFVSPISGTNLCRANKETAKIQKISRKRERETEVNGLFLHPPVKLSGIPTSLLQLRQELRTNGGIDLAYG